jgi:hypothetical protein
METWHGRRLLARQGLACRGAGHDSRQPEPEDWDATELWWYLAHRAEMFSTHHFANRIRRKAFEHAVRNRRL